MMSREEKLASLFDKQELSELTFRLCRAVDRGDEDGIRDCYHPDGRDDHGYPNICSPAEFASIAVTAVRAMGNWHHAITNQLFDLQGNTAYGESLYIFHSSSPSGRGMSCFGRYLDHFERRDGEWRILRRVVLVDWMGQVTAETFPTDHYLASKPDRSDPVYDIPRATTRPAQAEA